MTDQPRPVLTLTVRRSASGTLTLAIDHPDGGLSGPDMLAVGHAVTGLLTRLATR